MFMLEHFFNNISICGFSINKREIQTNHYDNYEISTIRYLLGICKYTHKKINILLLNNAYTTYILAKRFSANFLHTSHKLNYVDLVLEQVSS